MAVAATEYYMDDGKWKMSKKEGRGGSFIRNPSQGRCSFTRKCSSLVKEQRARFYIMRRCVTMLICWREYRDYWGKRALSFHSSLSLSFSAIQERRRRRNKYMDVNIFLYFSTLFSWMRCIFMSVIFLCEIKINTKNFFSSSLLGLLLVLFLSSSFYGFPSIGDLDWERGRGERSRASIWSGPLKHARDETIRVLRFFRLGLMKVINGYYQVSTFIHGSAGE